VQDRGGLAEKNERVGWARESLWSTIEVLDMRVITYANSHLSPPTLAFKEGMVVNLPDGRLCFVVIIPQREAGVLLELWDPVCAGRSHLVLVPYSIFIMIKGQAFTASDFMISLDGSSALVLYVAINCPEPIQVLSD
jgi:hypothetical protein